MKRFLIACFFAVLIGWAVLRVVNSMMPEDMITAWDRAGIIFGYIVTCLSTAIAITAFISRNEIAGWISRLARRRQFEGLGTPFDPLREKVDAIVIPVSRAEQPEWIMRHLKPRFVGLVFTEKTRKVTEELMQTASTLGIEPIFGRESLVRGLSDPNDPARSRSIARTMIEGVLANGVLANRIFVDTTGGRVPMTIGLFQAAEEAGVSSIYLTGREKDGRIINTRDPSEGRPIFISDHTEDVQ